MKKFITTGILASLCFVLVSWGFKGHQAVALIAENHLTPLGKDGVTALLGDQKISDVASWADEVRNQPDFKYTTPWHYINAPLGLNYEQFAKLIKGQGENNVYAAIEKCEATLKSSETSRAQKTEALKFLVHFVGDVHQPFHVSRAEDKGANTIQVQFNGNGTNLHSVWDGKLIDREGLTSTQMAQDYDKATSAEIAKWQHDDVMLWAFESYELATKFYLEVEKNNKLDDAYYNEHIGVVHHRIEQAGIRLAGLLNAIFKANPMLPTHNVYHPKQVLAAGSDSSAMHVELNDLPNNIGKNVSVSGLVYGTKELENMTLVNVGAAYPNQPLTVVLKGAAKDTYKDLEGKTIMVTGKAILYKGKPEIVVTDIQQLQVVPQLKVGKSGKTGGR